MDARAKAEAFRRGIECFNQRRFFDCHEVLEAIWLEEAEAEKPFYQGLIQVAAGFHQLFEKHNPHGALSLIGAGTEKLRRYPPGHGGLDLAGLLAALDPWLARLAAHGPTDDPPLPLVRPSR